MEGSRYDLALYSMSQGDWRKVLQLLEEGSSRGEGRCMWWLGWCYGNGVWVPKDRNKAKEWFQKGADAGDTRAMANLGWMLFRDGQTQKGIELGKSVLTKTNDDYAKALCHYEGLGTLKNYVKALFHYKQANDCFGNAWVSDCYFKGYGALKNEEEANNWDFLAASAGIPDSQHNLGVDFQLKKDYSSAIYWYRKAAEQQDADSQYKLIQVYLKLEKFAAALYWCLKIDGGIKYQSKVENILNTYRIMFDGVRKCQSCCMALISIRKYCTSDLNIFPKDVIILLAKYLWKTSDEEIWRQEEEEQGNNKRIKV
jgi:TPR repeat protein